MDLWIENAVVDLLGLIGLLSTVAFRLELDSEMRKLTRLVLDRCKCIGETDY